jgi:hypothetical protein
MTLQLEQFYREHLALAYTSIDRIYLRGYVPILQSGGGFRTWAERLRPDEPVTQAWIRSLARRFHDNVRKFAAEHDVPVVKPKKGQRKHLLADEYRDKFAGEQGVYLIITGFERAPDYVSSEPKRASNPNHRNLSKRTGYVTHYYFYILDPHWGPLCVSLSSHPPFNARVTLNAHHWIGSEAARRRLRFDKKTNAFLDCDRPEDLQQIADSLTERDIRRVADRWTYRVLPILTYKQRHDTRFHYQWSIGQMEVSHNLAFHDGYPLAELFQRHIDLNRRFLCPQSIATIFGARRNVGSDSRVSIYRSYDSLTVLRIKHHSSVIKQYDKHRRILRTECVCNDPNRFGTGRLLTNFHALRAAMTDAMQRFQQLQHGIADSTLDRGELAALAQTSALGRSRVPGIRLDNERITTVLHLLGRIATDPRGFAPADLRELYVNETGRAYSTSQASYDLRKLRAKGMLAQVPDSRRYVFTPLGARLGALFHKLRQLLIGPTLANAAAVHPVPHDKPPPKRRGPPPERPPIDRLRTLLHKHGGNIAAVARELQRQRCVVIRWIERERLDVSNYRQPVRRPDVEAAYRNLDAAFADLSKALACAA